jgi:Protein of unknown function (DUF433)
LLRAIAVGRTVQDLLADFPYLEEAEIREALLYAASHAQGREIPSPASAFPDRREPDSRWVLCLREAGYDFTDPKSARLTRRTQRFARTAATTISYS